MSRNRIPGLFNSPTEVNQTEFHSVMAAFSKQAPAFDEIEARNQILQWMRKQIHAHCMRYFKSGNYLLELNCGTGIDAVFFAMNGLKVHATDVAPGMLNVLRDKIREKKFEEKITVEQCSFTELEKIEHGKFNHIFSDFGGLNCVRNIGQVIASFKSLLKPGGTVTLVIMPAICPWEILLALKGNFKIAFRRWKKGGAISHLEGEQFMSYYFSPGKIKSFFGRDYEVVELQGLGSFVPPPYLDSFPVKHPQLFSLLKRWDEKFSHRFPFNRWADHFILTMKLK